MMASPEDNVSLAEPRLSDRAFFGGLEKGRVIAEAICQRFDALNQNEQASGDEYGSTTLPLDLHELHMELLVWIWDCLDKEELREARDTINDEEYWHLETKTLWKHLRDHRHQLNGKSTLNNTSNPPRSQTPSIAEVWKDLALSLRNELLETGMSQEELLDIRFSYGSREYYEIELKHLIKRLKSSEGIGARYSPRTAEDLDIAGEIYGLGPEVVKRNDGTEDVFNSPGKRTRNNSDGDYPESKIRRLGRYSLEA
ncbi:hypothetical protein GGR51DRAFT_416546 [Nemania sp. FL0031]|nr:hypothetical protein GGR51DRAFT_416546 [Nemania sp. FL0031]